MFEFQLDNERLEAKAKQYDLKVSVVGLPLIFISLFGVMRISELISNKHKESLLVLLFMPLFFGVLWLITSAVDTYRKLVKAEALMRLYEDHINQQPS